jgi:hypothetical protein
MTEQNDRLAREREEIAARVASFKATQEKFEREREEYFVTTLENARNGSDGKAFWSQSPPTAPAQDLPIPWRGLSHNWAPPLPLGSIAHEKARRDVPGFSIILADHQRRQ